MKFQIIDAYEKVKDDKKSFYVVAITDLIDYGQIKKGSVEIQVTPAQYEQLKNAIGKVADLDIVLPKPQYPIKVIELR